MIIEDTAAVIGLAVALIGVVLSQWLQNPYIDGIASIAIGAILLTVATFLAHESKGLLLGESARPEVLLQVQNILENNVHVVEFGLPQTMHFGPESILLIVEVDLEDSLELLKAEQVMEGLRNQIKQEVPKITQVYIQTTNKL